MTGCCVGLNRQKTFMIDPWRCKFSINAISCCKSIDIFYMHNDVLLNLVILGVIGSLVQDLNYRLSSIVSCFQDIDSCSPTVRLYLGDGSRI